MTKDEGITQICDWVIGRSNSKEAARRLAVDVIHRAAIDSINHIQAIDEIVERLKFDLACLEGLRKKLLDAIDGEAAEGRK